MKVEHEALKKIGVVDVECVPSRTAEGHFNLIIEMVGSYIFYSTRVQHIFYLEKAYFMSYNREKVMEEFHRAVTWSSKNEIYFHNGVFSIHCHRYARITMEKIVPMVRATINYLRTEQRVSTRFLWNANGFKRGTLIKDSFFPTVTPKDIDRLELATYPR